MEEWVASLSDAAAKLLLVLVLRDGQWPSIQVLVRLTGLSDKTLYKARKELLTPEGVSYSVEIFSATAKKGMEVSSASTEAVSTPPEGASAHPRLLRSEEDTYESEEGVPGYYEGRRPKTAQDEAAIQRMEAIQRRILAEKGRITW